MKKLLIDVNSIVHGIVTGKKTGIGRTTLELVEAIEKLENLPFEITLISQNMKGIGASYFSDRFRKIHIYLPFREKIRIALGKIPFREVIVKYDLLHIPTNFEYVYYPEKTIFTLHDALFMKIEDENFNFHKMRKVVPKMIKKAKVIITCSNHSKKDIIETMGIHPDKIHVIYWGYNKSIFKPKTNDNFNYLREKFKINRNYFFSYSCNTGRKNSEILVKAFLRYASEGGENDLVLIWPSPPIDIIELVEKNPYRNKLHFLNNVNDFHLALLLQHSIALIYPSSYEGFGLPVIEGLACGTLVLTGNNSSLLEVGGDAAFYLDNLTVEDIHNGLNTIVKNQKNRIRIVERGLIHVEQFSWEKTAIEYVNLYEELLITKC